MPLQPSCPLLNLQLKSMHLVDTENRKNLHELWSSKWRFWFPIDIGCVLALCERKAGLRHARDRPMFASLCGSAPGVVGEPEISSCSGSGKEVWCAKQRGLSVAG